MPFTLARTIPEFELFETKKLDPPPRLTFVLCPAAMVGFVVPKVTDPLELVEPTATESVPQVLLESQTVMVALPFATAFTVSAVPDRLVETAEVFELLEMLYVPLPPETVTVWLEFADIERLFWLNVMPDTVPVCAFTERLTQLEEVPV